MAKGTDETKAPAARKRRVPSAVNLLVYLENYLSESDIGKDQPIASVLDRLEDSIVAEAKSKIGS